jgi:hypothetical protein
MESPDTVIRCVPAARYLSGKVVVAVVDQLVVPSNHCVSIHGDPSMSTERGAAPQPALWVKAIELVPAGTVTV